MATVSDDGPALAAAVETLPDLCTLPTFREYLLSVLRVVLGADEEDLEASILDDADSMEYCARFISDSGIGCLYVAKDKLARREDDGGNKPLAFGYSIRSELGYTPTLAAALCLIKRVPVIEANRPIQSQLSVRNLPGPAAAEERLSGGEDEEFHPVADESNTDAPVVASAVINPYESIHNVIHHAVSPYFNAYTLAKTRQDASLSTGARDKRAGIASDDKESKLGIPMTKKKFAELELSLVHLQQNVEIPEIVLSIHPAISRVIEKSRELGRSAKAEDLDAALLSDSSFLNRLQNDVNGWVREIQKVTKLSRDVSSGRAIQEINFWLSKERAIERIEEQLRSDQIQLTMEVLRHAKRFHATVSFRADTHIKEATEQVFKYNQLMKDFPLNELLSATDVQKCKEAIELIFNHLNKKLRLSPYPIRRALPLVEAISRDLNDQLLKVLGSRRLMMIEYDEFDRATQGAEMVFRTWDEFMKEFTNVAREVTRKRNEKFIPIKINAAHTKLQERIAFVRTFRLQHEQLHQTILKVMQRPEGSKASKEGVHDKSAEALDLGSEDIDAVAEVALAYDCVRNVEVLDVTSEGTEIWVTAENAYNERVSRVENQIIASLRDRLGTAKNATEMFRVFSKFNALFVRPKVCAVF